MMFPVDIPPHFLKDFYGQQCLVPKSAVDAFIDYMITIYMYLAALIT